MIKPKESRRVLAGWQHLYEFSNGYGASVVCHSFSYGGDDGRFELAVIEWDDTKYPQGWDFAYDIPGASDVQGWLTSEDVQERLQKLQKFPGVRGKCEGGYSGCLRHGRRIRDPYVYELRGTSVMTYLCSHCYSERCADV